MSELNSVVTDRARNLLIGDQGLETNNLYEQIQDEMEKPLLNVVLAKTRQNQSKAAIILGINRNTLRKKMKRHGLL